MSDPVPWSDLSGHFQGNSQVENDLIEEVLKSRKTAWRVATAGLVLAVLGLGAGAASLYRAAPDPVVLRVDNATGAVEVVETMADHQTTYGEAVDKYWLRTYVLNCEGYDWHTIQMQYDTCAVLSSPARQQEYRKVYDGPNARDKVLVDRAKITVTIRSIQRSDAGQAVVRFATTQVNKDGSEDIPKPQIATVGYEYVNAPMRYEDRLKNPLGFQVTAYSVTQDAP